MNYQDLFEKYMLSKNKEKEIQTPVSASIEILEPKKMLGKSNISEEEFDKIFEEIINRKV